ncbi:MAG TPA: SRPBCC family protein [Arenicellales bacterium]|nr:SRPBCC family protein [Arenicellales bacterium]
MNKLTMVQVIESVKADAKAVWDILGDFGGIKIGGPVTAFEVTGEGVGATRSITMGGALIVERLESYDPENFTFSYAIINEDCPLPVADYSAFVKITADEDGCIVDWTGNFEPKDAPEEQASEMVRGIYTGAIAGARKALES